MENLLLVGATLLVLTSVANAQSVPSAAENAACNAPPNRGPASILCSQLRNQREKADRATNEAAAVRRLAQQNKENADRANRYRDEQAAKEEEAAKPENLLKAAYSNYIDVKRCFESRLGYQEVYNSEPEMENSKKFVAAIDHKLHVLTKDEIWSELASKPIDFMGMKVTFEMYLKAIADGIGYTPRGLCQTYYGALQSTYTAMFPAASQIKKDF